MNVMGNGQEPTQEDLADMLENRNSTKCNPFWDINTSDWEVEL